MKKIDALNLVPISDFCPGGNGQRVTENEIRLQTLAEPQVVVDFQSNQIIAPSIDEPGIQFITIDDVRRPITPDAFTFGEIAAANALSELYAMGGEPLFAQHILVWPGQVDLESGPALNVLEGGRTILKEADAESVSITAWQQAEEVMYGLSVQGKLHPDRLISSDSGREGYDLVLTKPLGTGFARALLLQGFETDELREAAIRSMIALNRTASEVAVTQQIRTGVDINSAGLLGDLHRIVTRSGVGAEIYVNNVPVIQGVRTEVEDRRLRTADGRRNERNAEAFTQWGNTSPAERAILTDSQISGGLLLAAPDGIGLRSALDHAGVPSAHIGRLTSRRNAKPISIMANK